MTADITQLYGIPGGVIVASVVKDGPADKAGIKEKDIITELDGRSVANMEQLQDTLQYYAAGEKVDVVLQRANNGKYEAQTVTVTLGSAQEKK
nr:PDZ domain-containing protein [uncultured Sellimonas sp.]